MAEKGSNDKSNKTLRAYLVYDYVFKRITDFEFTTSQINAYLETYGIYCDNRAIARDIEAINQAYIMVKNELDDVDEANRLLLEKKNQLIVNEYRNSYSINRPKFGNDFFELIWECVCASRSIDAKTTERLKKNLEFFISPYSVERLKDNENYCQREKISVDEILPNIQKIQSIINNNIEYKEASKVEFVYSSYDIKHLGKPLNKHTHETVLVSPHKIVNSNGLYYLIAYDSSKRKMLSFRIDRMSDVEEYCVETQDGIRLAQKIDFPHLSTRTFDMCLGENERVSMRFSNIVFDEVFERFGNDDAIYRQVDNDSFEVSLTLGVSPKFFGWLCGFGKDAQIVSPPSIVEQFTSYIDEIKNKY